LFGDYKSSAVRAITVKNGAATPIAIVSTLNYFGKAAPQMGITSFGEDAAGELYIINAPSGGSASIYRIAHQSRRDRYAISVSVPGYPVPKLVAGTSIRFETDASNRLCATPVFPLDQ